MGSRMEVNQKVAWSCRETDMSKYLYFYVAVLYSMVFLTEAKVWPKPQSEKKGKEIFSLNPESFEFKIMVENCTLLRNATERYKQIIKGHEEFEEKDLKYLSRTTQLYSPLEELRIYLSSPCDLYPTADMDESYCLTVSRVSELRGKSVWGILRGLETFAQLFEPVNRRYRVKRIRATKIVDYPRYSHRGFLIDTARHFLSTDTILKHLEAMAINKFNVLHWHIMDAQSFPYKSDKFPELSQYGAFDNYRVYDKRAIRKIVDFAAERGIRVIPEIDLPAHTSSWGRSHPEVTVQDCSYPGVMNPARNSTYYLISQLIGELRLLFPDKYMHLGGDEVPFECWTNDEEVRNYMELNNLDVHKLFNQFIDRVRQFLPDRTPIYWEDVFTAEVSLNNSLLQIWIEFRTIKETVETMSKIMDAGLHVIYSRGWYLDPSLDTTLESAYQTDPRSIYYRTTTGFADTLDQIIGGEACLWAEDVDDLNFHNLAWPRAAAIAEVLWSARDLLKIPGVPYKRIREQMKRMHQRGLPVENPLAKNKS